MQRPTNNNSKDTSTLPEPDNREFIRKFIKKPFHNCTGEMLEKGAQAVVSLLATAAGPETLLAILNHHPITPANDYYVDLADKMKSQNCLDKLDILVAKCPDKLVESCAFNLHDLERWITTIPGQKDTVMQLITASDKHMQRILDIAVREDRLDKLSEICSAADLVKFNECLGRMQNTRAPNV